MTCGPDPFSPVSADSISPLTGLSEPNQPGCAKPTPTAAPSSSSGFPACPSSPTSGSSTTPPAPSTCCTAATPASRSASPANAKARMIPDTCGPSSPDAFAFYDPASSSLKTSQGTLLSDSTPCSPTLPKWGSMCGGELYERRMLALPTSGRGCSGLPTPRATDGKVGSTREDWGNALPEAVALLPTPAAQEPGGTAEAHLHRKNRLDGANRTTPTHLAFIEHLLPTPAVNDMGAGKTPEAWDEWTDRMREAHGNGNGHGRSLSIEAQRLLPTPTTQDAANTAGPSQFKRNSDPLNVTAAKFGGASTSLPSDGGNTPPASPPPGQLTIEDA